MAFVEFKLTGVDGVLETLRSLPKEIVSKAGGPVRVALRKGAVVIQKQELLNLQVVTANANDEGKVHSTGFLAKNVIVSRGKAPIGGKGERYLVRVKRKAYDGQKLTKRQKAGKRVTTLQTANLLEYGSEKQPAEPWIRPAFNSKAREAISVTETELVKAIDRVVAKLAAANKGK